MRSSASSPPGGRVLIITANTPAQIEWLKQNPQGWDNDPFFESASCIIFGGQDYEANTHRNYMSPEILTDLLQAAGFETVTTLPYGERATDMQVEAHKPLTAALPNVLGDQRGEKARAGHRRQARL